MSKSSSISRAGKPALRQKNVAATQVTASDSELNSDRIDQAARRAMVAEAAYYRAERRGFAPGFELEDWLLSESELDTQSPNQIQQQRLEKSTPSSGELH